MSRPLSAVPEAGTEAEEDPCLAAADAESGDAVCLPAGAAEAAAGLEASLLSCLGCFVPELGGAPADEGLRLEVFEVVRVETGGGTFWSAGMEGPEEDAPAPANCRAMASNTAATFAAVLAEVSRNIMPLLHWHGIDQFI